MTYQQITDLLGKENEDLFTHTCKKIPRSALQLPSPHFSTEVWSHSNRNLQTLRSLQQMFNTGRLSGTGYLSILPVDQGVEHSAGASFAKNPMYFDPENIVRLALEAGCNAVASTFGILGMVARKYAHRIPFIVKINHNELLSYPNKFDQILFGSVKDAWNMGAAAIGATIYFGSEESDRQITQIALAFDEAHQLGMATVLWCYLRNKAFVKDGKDYVFLPAELERIRYNSGRIISGTPDEVKQQLNDLAADLGVNEIMVTCMTHSQDDRIRSFELLAEAFELKQLTVDNGLIFNSPFSILHSVEDTFSD